MSIKQTNELTSKDFNLSTNKGLIRRGFFDYVQFMQIAGGQDKKYHFAIKQTTLDNINKFIADSKLDTKNLSFFVREKAIVFIMDTKQKKIYKFNSGVFYADKIAQDNKDNGWTMTFIDNINDLSIVRTSNTNNYAQTRGFVIK